MAGHTSLCLKICRTWVPCVIPPRILKIIFTLSYLEMLRLVEKHDSKSRDETLHPFACMNHWKVHTSIKPVTVLFSRFHLNFSRFCEPKCMISMHFNSKSCENVSTFACYGKRKTKTETGSGTYPKASCCAKCPEHRVWTVLIDISFLFEKNIELLLFLAHFFYVCGRLFYVCGRSRKDHVLDIVPFTFLDADALFFSKPLKAQKESWQVIVRSRFAIAGL